MERESESTERVLGVSVNQDASCAAVVTRKGFIIYNIADYLEVSTESTTLLRPISPTSFPSLLYILPLLLLRRSVSATSARACASRRCCTSPRCSPS